MKTIINKLPIIFILFFFNFYRSQNKERYINDYNKAMPKLQIAATAKQQFYGKNFSNFLSQLEKTGVKIKGFYYMEKDLSPKVYTIILKFTENGFGIAIDNNYQLPEVVITFQEQIPNEIRQLTKNYRGELTKEVKDFLANRKIEKIEFYGINGLKSKDRSAR